MPVDSQAVLREIDQVISETGSRPDRDELGSDMYSAMLLMSALERLSPTGSVYRTTAEKLREKLWGNAGVATSSLRGQLRALRADYAAGRLAGVQELIHADVFSDYLDMAAHLLESGYKDPAAVLAGSTLEEHIRKLCVKHLVDLVTLPDGEPRKAQAMVQDLAKKGAYSTTTGKQVTAWLGLRNDAAHGEYAKFGAPEVRLMIAGVRDFISRTPA